MKTKKRFFFLTLLVLCFVSYNESSLKASSDLMVEQEDFHPLAAKGEPFNPTFDDFVEISLKFKEELRTHKMNGILLRGTVPRANQSYREGDVEKIFDIDFEELQSFISENPIVDESPLLKEWEKNVCFFIRVIQAISEDQNYLIGWIPAQDSKRKLDNIIALKGTVQILEKNLKFAVSYNHFVERAYAFLWKRFPGAAVFSGDEYLVEEQSVLASEFDHESILKSFADTPKQLFDLFESYNRKLKIRDECVTLLKLDEVGKTLSDGNMPKIKRRTRRMSETNIWKVDENSKDIIRSHYKVQWDGIECNKKSPLILKKASNKGTKKDKKKRTKKVPGKEDKKKIYKKKTDRLIAMHSKRKVKFGQYVITSNGDKL